MPIRRLTAASIEATTVPSGWRIFARHRLFLLHCKIKVAAAGLGPLTFLNIVGPP